MRVRLPARTPPPVRLAADPRELEVVAVLALKGLEEVIGSGRFDLLSTDVFDTVVLRDRSLEVVRLAEVGRRAAGRLGVDPATVVRLRWTLHRSAYLAVAMEHPDGEARLSAICRAMAAALGLEPEAADVLASTEVEVDAEHLRPHEALLDVLRGAHRSGVRVVAVSDTYYSADDLRHLLERVVGSIPVDAVYSSADEQATKHRGGLYPVVTRAEGVGPGRVLHLGDTHHVDVVRAREAGWTAVHLPRDRRHRVEKAVGALLGAPSTLRRAW